AFDPKGDMKMTTATHLIFFPPKIRFYNAERSAIFRAYHIIKESQKAMMKMFRSKNWIHRAFLTSSHFINSLHVFISASHDLIHVVPFPFVSRNRYEKRKRS